MYEPPRTLSMPCRDMYSFVTLSSSNGDTTFSITRSTETGRCLLVHAAPAPAMCCWYRCVMLFVLPT